MKSELLKFQSRRIRLGVDYCYFWLVAVVSILSSHAKMSDVIAVVDGGQSQHVVFSRTL